MRETVRSGRKANFYITENSFIDNYARQAGPVGTAVYHVLERYMNYETRSTWVGTAKMAELLNLSQRTVQRYLKTLEDLRLIRILRTATMTTYVVMPVPPRGKSVVIPLFDEVQEKDIIGLSDISVAGATSASQHATSASRSNDTRDAPYKEDQDLLNKTSEQEGTKKSIPSSNKSAERTIAILGLPATPGNVGMVEAAVVAEAAYTGQSFGEAAEFITKAAIEDRENGIPINKFYFEDAKFRRSNVKARIGRAEQRKIHNLEANARVKQRFRERFSDS